MEVPRVVEVSQGVYVMELWEEGFFGSRLNHNVVLFTRGPGGGALVVDTSLPGNLGQLESGFRSLGLFVADVSEVVITHHHPDHSGNGKTIVRESGARVISGAEEAHYLMDGTTGDVPRYCSVLDNFPALPRGLYEETASRIRSLTVEPMAVDLQVKGEMKLDDFVFLSVPGHTRGHIAVMRGGVLVVGDAVRNVGKLSPPLRCFSEDYETAVNSFRRITSMRYNVMVPYHGSVVLP